MLFELAFSQHRIRMSSSQSIALHLLHFFCIVLEPAIQSYNFNNCVRTIASSSKYSNSPLNFVLKVTYRHFCWPMLKFANFLSCCMYSKPRYNLADAQLE